MKRGPIQKKLLTNYCQYLSLGGEGGGRWVLTFTILDFWGVDQSP